MRISIQAAVPGVSSIPAAPVPTSNLCLSRLCARPPASACAPARCGDRGQFPLLILGRCQPARLHRLCAVLEIRCAADGALTVSLRTTLSERHQPGDPQRSVALAAPSAQRGEQSLCAGGPACDTPRGIIISTSSLASYASAGCSPAEPACASPAERHYSSRCSTPMRLPASTGPPVHSLLTFSSWPVIMLKPLRG